MRIFGTDGIRAKTYEFPLELRLLRALGRAFEIVLPKSDSLGTILFARDTRASGKEIFKALSSGFAKRFRVIDLGVLPTPSLGYLVNSWNAILGCVISASHNPPQFNGVKFFDQRGQKIPEAWEQKMEHWLLEDLKSSKGSGVSGFNAKAVVSKSVEAHGQYQNFLTSTVATDVDFKGLKVVVDCANGAAYRLLPELLRRLGAQVISLGIKPSGSNINHLCGAMDPRALAKAVVASRADVGFALDGDGDRLVVVTEKGAVVPGESVMATVALHRKEARQTGSGVLVTTTMSNLALKRYLEKRGIEVFETPVGDRWVLEKLLETGGGFGGENSGHFIWPRILKSADGSLGALTMLELLARRNMRASEVFVDLPFLPQTTLQVEVDWKPDLRTLPVFQKKLSEVQKALDNQGRVFVRYSGTEPALRILVEGNFAKTKIRAMAESLKQAYQESLKFV